MPKNSGHSSVLLGALRQVAPEMKKRGVSIRSWATQAGIGFGTLARWLRTENVAADVSAVERALRIAGLDTKVIPQRGRKGSAGTTGRSGVPRLPHS